MNYVKIDLCHWFEASVYNRKVLQSKASCSLLGFEELLKYCSLNVVDTTGLKY